MLTKINYENSLEKKSTVYIDVRTPAEYEESTIPGSVNIPVFSTQERKKIGTVYKNESPAKARMLGVEILSPKIPAIIKKIKKIKFGYNYVIIFCSRGNLRSESIVKFCELAGLKVFQLEGGYKAYRHFILDELDDYQLQNQLYLKILLHFLLAFD
jgi:tRNA 2-selenouridine synthase